MTRVMVIGAGRQRLGLAIAAALSEAAMKVTLVCPSESGMYTFNLSCSYRTDDYRRTEQDKKVMRDQARYNEAGVQQRRKALAKFHKEKRARMAQKQATKRRNRFV